MRILITGIAGHIGSRFAHWVTKNHPYCEIVGVDDLSGGYWSNVPSEVLYCQQCNAGDCENYCINRRGIFDQQYDAVFHFAAYAAECMSPFCRAYNYANNIVASAKLINACIRRKVGRVVFASSAAVYGAANDFPPYCEFTEARPNDPYGVAKLAVEHDLRIAGEQHELDWCVLRMHNVYGPQQSIWQKHRNVLGLWMRAVLEDQRPIIFGDGNQRRAFTFDWDVMPCIWQAGVAPAASERVINLGGSKPISIVELADTFGYVVGGRIGWDFAPARHEARDTWCSTELSHELLGYEDRTSLIDGIKQMWDWARNAWELYPERRNQPEPFEIELSEGMPQSWGNSNEESRAENKVLSESSDV